ncbi:hypothetical protein EJ110_NYTH28694 [Nymphaea thermarum]|nr:hypothetical protein EJ110_NYTH28694 [Nymphaea thermarum]
MGLDSGGTSLLNLVFLKIKLLMELTTQRSVLQPLMAFLGEKMEEGPAIGIDLGTTNSYVGVVEGNQVTIIHNEQGKMTTASCIAFIDGERLFGEEPGQKELH